MIRGTDRAASDTAWVIDMRKITEVVMVVTICSVPLAAQWPKYQVADVPRDAEGRVRMDAPTPRMPDGKPDLSGNWVRVRGEGAFDPPELQGVVPATGRPVLRCPLRLSIRIRLLSLPFGRSARTFREDCP